LAHITEEQKEDFPRSVAIDRLGGDFRTSKLDYMLSSGNRSIGASLLIKRIEVFAREARQMSQRAFNLKCRGNQPFDDGA
jgi:hypothetical protein